MGGLEQTLGGRLAVDGVDHHLLGLDVLDGLQPGSNVCLARVVDALPVTFTAHKHRLDDQVAIECLHPLDDGVHIVSAVRVIHLIYIYGVDGVEFQDVVVH